ncbi:mitotic checkpoint serine/threonine-protein kinase BUB1 isoform X2 [Festucalex cinctus]
MDVSTCLKAFESRFSAYMGDDPLDAWLKFVEYLDENLPADGSSEMSLVLARLVQNFLSVERYADDERFVNMCIRYAAYYAEPIALFDHIFSEGVGTRTAALYVAWAQCFEQKAMTEQADAVYLKALENQARPTDNVVEEYRKFQVRSRSQETVSEGAPTLPQNPHPPSDSVPAATSQPQTKPPSASTQPTSELQPSEPVYVRTVSRSSSHPPERSERAFVSMYSKDALTSEAFELCFEEVRARLYFQKRQQQREAEERLGYKCGGEGSSSSLSPPPPASDPCPVAAREAEHLERKDDEAVSRLRHQVHEMSRKVVINSTMVCHQGPQEGWSETQRQENVNAPQQNAHVSHITPSNSLSSQHATATPSNVTPSPTVNTRQALDVIMGMFQFPTLAEEPSSDTSAVVTSGKPSDDANGSAQLVNSTAVKSFTIYQDDVSAAASHTLGKSKETRGRGLTENLPSTEANMAAAAGWSQQDKMANEASVWAEGWLAACPNNTADFAPAARCVSTPFAHTWTGNAFQGTDATCADREGDENTFIRRPCKLSPIIEQSPPDEKPSGSQPASSFAAHAGTIVGEALASHQLSSSSATLVQAPPPPVALSFGDRTALGGPLPAARPFTIADDLQQDYYPHKNATASLQILVSPASADQHVARGVKVEENLYESQGSGIKVSHVTPNNSVSCQQAATTPARVPPSPTVNTREALDVIMGMFQAPTMTEHPLSDMSAFVTSEKPADDANSSAPQDKYATTEPFTIYQDDNSAVSSRTLGKSKATQGRGLSENLPTADKMADETSIGGDGWLAACPNNTVDFALAARCVSTPFAHKGPGEAHGAVDMTCAGEEANKNTFIGHMQKLGPITEQSPPDEKSPASATNQSAASRVFERPNAHQLIASCSPDAMAWAPMSLPSTDQHMASPEKECPRLPDAAPRSSESWSSDSDILSIDQHMASPEKERGRLSDTAQLVSDPWSSELISDLLSRMNPPLTSHPQCVIWQRRLPDIAAKKTISMGKASLQVDRVLGQGAFATVYQATNPANSAKMVLKVQKTDNLWEFYINTQLDHRLPPSTRHLFARMHSVHAFTDGSILLGELHGYGTLLNAANVYKSDVDKVMPQPLVIYFAVCILRMLEELHAACIVHADVKPDNFVLGQRFVENDEVGNLDHGLVLIDMGQSIDMDLFPLGTAFTARCLTSSFQCTEMLSGKPWSYQTDLFGVAGTLHVLLFGSYMQVVQEDGEWKTRASFRRMPHGDMWQHLFRTLLNVPACRPSTMTLADLRDRLSAVLQRDYCHKLLSLKNRLLVRLLASCKATQLR